MKQPALAPTLLALTFAVGAAMALAPGCDGEATTTGPGGSAGDGGSGGATASTSAPTTSSSTVNPLCEELCFHLQEINCNVLTNCLDDCQNHLNAPEQCHDEADQLIQCWVDHLSDFMCTQMQVLPPIACTIQETEFNTCVNGGGAPDASCICSNGVGVGDGVNNCSRKTTCGMIEFTQTCKKLNDGEPWTCSCFANGGLLGTCSEPAEFEHCSNQYGCCVPLFCASASE